MDTVDAVRRRFNVLLVDVHQTGKFDQDGINARIRNMLSPHSTPIIDKPRHSTLASYCPDPPRSVDIYVEHVAPEMPFPDMPIFLNPDRYINVPLEATLSLRIMLPRDISQQYHYKGFSAATLRQMG